MNRTSANKRAPDTDIKVRRNVVRCKTCRLVQYGTRAGNCRRCFRVLTPKTEFLIPLETWSNHVVVKQIGQRIRQLRESHRITLRQIRVQSHISRSLMSRIERGKITPTLATIEKISEAIDIGLKRLFVPAKNGESLVEDPFIRGLLPYLRLLEWEQWQSIMKRLVAISGRPLSFASDSAAPVRSNRRCAQIVDSSCRNETSLVG